MNHRASHPSDTKNGMRIELKPRLVLIGCLLLWLVPALALADALVVVEVRGATTSGVVELRSTSPDGPTLRCTTVENRCRIDGVRGGRYEVSFRGDDGSSHRAQPAMIPPRGTVTLVIPVQ